MPRFDFEIEVSGSGETEKEALLNAISKLKDQSVDSLDLGSYIVIRVEGMTYKGAVEQFKEFLPAIPKEDVVARREAWNNFTDALCKDGLITDHDYEEWPHPPCVESGDE